MNAQFNNNLVSKLKKYQTATISDALDVLGINGGIEGILPLSPGMKAFGPAYTLAFSEADSQESGKAADYIDEVPEGHIVLIDNEGKSSCTVWGDILSYVSQMKGIAGTIIHGSCRDVEKIIKLGYPVFSKGRFMKSGKSRVKLQSKQQPLMIKETTINPGDIICADASGVVVIPQNAVELVLKLICEIEHMESLVLEDVQKGMTLKDARKKHNYNAFSLRRGG